MSSPPLPRRLVALAIFGVEVATAVPAFPVYAATIAYNILRGRHA